MTLIALLSASGCVVQNTIIEDDVQTLRGAVDHVNIELHAGDLVVEIGDQGGAEISRRWEFTGEPPALYTELHNGVLTIETDCRPGQFICQIDHVIRLPAAAGITVETGSGDVWVMDMRDVEAKTGSGDVQIDAASGDLVVGTGSGDVSIIHSTSTVALISTGSGDVDADLVIAPDLARVDTGSGDVLLEVPSGAYDIRTDTGSGDVTLVDVTDAAASDRRLDINTGSGDIRVQGR